MKSNMMNSQYWWFDHNMVRHTLNIAKYIDEFYIKKVTTKYAWPRNMLVTYLNNALSSMDYDWRFEEVHKLELQTHIQMLKDSKSKAQTIRSMELCTLLFRQWSHELYMLNCEFRGRDPLNVRESLIFCCLNLPYSYYKGRKMGDCLRLDCQPLTVNSVAFMRKCSKLLRHDLVQHSNNKVDIDTGLVYVRWSGKHNINFVFG